MGRKIRHIGDGGRVCQEDELPEEIKVKYSGYKSVHLRGLKFYRPYFSDLLGRKYRYSRRVFRTATAAVAWGRKVAARFANMVIK